MNCSLSHLHNYSRAARFIAPELEFPASSDVESELISNISNSCLAELTSDTSCFNLTVLWTDEVYSIHEDRCVKRIFDKQNFSEHGGECSSAERRSDIWTKAISLASFYTSGVVEYSLSQNGFVRYGYVCHNCCVKLNINNCPVGRMLDVEELDLQISNVYSNDDNVCSGENVYDRENVYSSEFPADRNSNFFRNNYEIFAFLLFVAFLVVFILSIYLIVINRKNISR